MALLTGPNSPKETRLDPIGFNAEVRAVDRVSHPSNRLGKFNSPRFGENEYIEIAQWFRMVSARVQARVIVMLPRLFQRQTGLHFQSFKCFMYYAIF